MRSILALTLAASTSAFAFDFDFDSGRTEKGNGKIVTRNFENLPAFNAVSVGHGVQATITHGDTPSVTLEGDENLVAKFDVQVSNGWLKTKLPRNISIRPTKRIHLRVVVKDLQRLSAGGGASVQADLLSGDEIQIESSGGARVKAKVSASHAVFDSSGGARIEVTGATRTTDIDVSGGAQVSASDFTTDSAKVDASGGARAEIRAARSIDVDSSGGARVNVSGNPAERRIESSGGARVVFGS